MLLEFSIKNFAIIDDLKIKFSNGLNVLTGETGSGKSIIIEALGIVLGGRGNKELIRTGKDRAILQAIFVLEDTEYIKSILDEYGIVVEEDKLLIITRELPSDSPSISRINDKVVTLSILNKISHNLVDIFAQNEHQSLLNTGNHRLIIDSFGDANHRNLMSKIKSLYQEYIKEKNLLDDMNLDIMERERLIDLNRFQLGEINNAQLTIYDDEEIENDFKKYSNVVNIIEGINEVVGSFNNDNYGSESLLDNVNRNISILNSLIEYDNELLDYLNRFKDINFELQDLRSEFTNYMDSIQFDEERLNALTERLDTVNKLKKKYGGSVNRILEYRDSIEKSLEKLLNYEHEIKILAKKIEDYEIQLYTLSRDLSKSRKSIGLKLEKSVSLELNELNMKNVNLKVDIKDKKTLSSDGIDKIEFLISTNIGEDLKAMSKIASGGEMSRIMLGFKSILAEYDGIPTLIFDEIDSGIGGRTAQVVGQKIYKISKNRQVISVSHLAQIAAIADSQYSIYKEAKNGKIATNIKELDESDRIHELAKIMGGVDLTETTIEHAKEMLEMAKKYKNEKL